MRYECCTCSRTVAGSSNSYSTKRSIRDLNIGEDLNFSFGAKLAYISVSFSSLLHITVQPRRQPSFE